MDSFKFHDLKVEKAVAISRYCRSQMTTALFQFLKLFAFLIVASRFSTQCAFPFKLSGMYLREIITESVIGRPLVFVIGNAIVIVLLWISGQLSSKNGERSADFYEEYVDNCRNYHPQACVKEEKKVSDAKKFMKRIRAENLEMAVRGEERRRHLRGSTSRKSVGCGRKAAVAGGAGDYPRAENEMSSEEFRRRVEAFIARQQRFLREEEELPSVVSSKS